MLHVLPPSTNQMATGFDTRSLNSPQDNKSGLDIVSKQLFESNAQEPAPIWLCAYQEAQPVIVRTQAQELAATEHAAKPLNAQERAAISFEPKGPVKETFTAGEHTVTDGVYVARGKAKVKAEGSAVVYAFDEAYVTGKDNVVLYGSDKAVTQASGKATIYARGSGEAYGFDDSTIYAFDTVEIHAHDRPKVFAHDKVNAFVNDSSTTFAYDRSVVWPRHPLPPDMDYVNAFDNATVVTASRKVDGKELPNPTIKLHGNAVWIEYEPQFGNPVIHRASDK